MKQRASLSLAFTIVLTQLKRCKKSVSSNKKTEGQSKILPDMNLFSL